MARLRKMHSVIATAQTATAAPVAVPRRVTVRLCASGLPVSVAAVSGEDIALILGYANLTSMMTYNLVKDRVKPRRAAGLVSLVVAGLLFAGCSSTDPAESPAASSTTPAASADVTDSTSAESKAADTAQYTTPRTMPEGKGSGQADGVFPRTVKHFQGETTLEAEPQRVVVISTGQADVMLTLGIVPVASTSGDGADMIPPYLATAFSDDSAELEAMTYVGSRFEPDIEAIANTNPDLIVMNNAGKDAGAMYTALSAIAPTVATQGTGLYWKQDFLLLADSVGKTDEAQAWLDKFHADAAEFGAGVSGNPTVSFLRKNGDRTRVFGIASFSGSVAEDAGLARPESQSFTDETSVDISAEQLEQADGDWIFFGVQGGDETELTSAPLWPTLTAVESGQAVEVDDDVFYLNVGPTAARGILTAIEGALG